MADFLNVPTLNSDDEGIDYQDKDSDFEDAELINQGKKSRKKKEAQNEFFNQGFQFEFQDIFSDDLWAVDKGVKESVKGKIDAGNVAEKIAKKRQQRKQKKMKLVENGHEDGNEKQGNEGKPISGDEEDSDKDSSDQEDNEADDKKVAFFIQPPPQVLHEKFTQMNLSRPVLKAVNEAGFVHPTPIQSATIPVALLGKDVCACAATGTGKTAAFMLPILERLLYRPKDVASTRVLILVPTRELAIQVHSVSLSLAKYSNVQLCLATGGLDSKSQEAALRKNPDIVIATPGRLVDHLLNAPTFDLQTIEILVLDEADRMLDENFKEEMDEIIRLSPKGRQTMLFSATMTDEVEELASLSLNKPVRLFVNQNTTVASNLHQEFVRIRQHREQDRQAIVAALVCRNFGDHSLVFVKTKVMTHRLRIIFGMLGVNVGELHGNLTQAQRLDALEKFKSGEIDVLVATDLAARGLDIIGVKTVINLSLPTKLKSYIHRVGRTARAGKSGRSISLVGENERKMLKEIVKNSKIPVKNRIIPPEVIDKYRQKLEDIEKDVKDILKEEAEEKELRVSEMEVSRAKNLIVHQEEIANRPPRTWIKGSNKNSTKAEEQRSKNASQDLKKSKRRSEEDLKLRKEQEFITRQAKRDRRPKRLRACPEEEPSKRKPLPISKKSSMNKKASGGTSRGFERELTDISSKALKEFRSSAYFGPKGKGKPGKFKSRKRYKRR